MNLFGKYIYYSYEFIKITVVFLFWGGGGVVCWGLTALLRLLITAWKQ